MENGDKSAKKKDWKQALMINKTRYHTPVDGSKRVTRIVLLGKNGSLFHSQFDYFLDLLSA